MEMKKILQQLVDSLFVMTNKINRMQNAINYINNTFHERNESLKSVADTIAAMTHSLNNFNFNLKNINDTLKSFKLFMKDMNNSLLDIDDVIRYLDESIVNLDETVAHLDDSVQDMNGTLLIIRVRAEDIDTSLKMINRTVIDVRDTTLSTNITLDSMNRTLLKLNDIIFSFGKKIDDVLNGLDGINISLRNINDSIHNSYFRLRKLGDKIKYMNETIENINSTMKRLNESYDRIEDALRQMNESFSFLNGTFLGNLLDLSMLNGTLGNVSYNVHVIDNNKGKMNRSLTNALDWMIAMMETVNSLNVSIEKQNDSVIIGIKDKHVLDTLNSLLAMNGSLINTSRNVDDVNDNLSQMEQKMDVLEVSLKQIEDSLDNMNSTFVFLNNILSKINETLLGIGEPLNSINETLQTLSETSNDIETSLNNVEQTIESANKSTGTIHGFVLSATNSAQNINETILNIDLKSGLLRESVQDVIEESDNLTGSLPDVSQKLANNEEAINIMKEEFSILNKSMGIIDDKLSVLTSTFDRMKTELNMTSEALYKSDSNLIELERVINEVSDTLVNISHTLNNISGSLADLNAGFTNISSAFPNIDIAISKVISSTNMLEDIEEMLMERNVISRDEATNSATAASIIFDDLYSLQNLMDDLSNTIAELATTKLDGINKLNSISDLLNMAEFKHEENSQKVKLLSPSFEKLIGKYKQLTNKSADVVENINIPHETLDGLKKRLVFFTDTIRNYSNLKVDLRDDSDKISNLRNALFQTNDLFADSLEDFKLQNNTVWHENAHPRLRNVTLQDITDNMQNLNLTLDSHEKAIQKTYRTSGEIEAFSDVLRAKFDALNKTLNKLDKVDTKSSQVNLSLGPLVKGYDNQINEIDKLIQQFEQLTKDIDDIEGLYGNISDSNSTAHIYGKIRRLLDELISQREKVENERLLLHDTKNGFDKLLKDFENTDIGLESGPILDKILGKLDGTFDVINNLNAALNGTNNSVNLTNKLLEETGLNIRELERKLEAKMKKNTYVDKYGPKIRKELETFTFEMNDTMGLIQQLNETILNLTDFMSRLNESAKLDDAIDFSFTYETRSLSDSSTSLLHIKRHLNDAVIKLGNTRDAYETFDTDNASLSEVKDTYQQYLTSVAALNDEVLNSRRQLKEIESDVSIVDGNLQNVFKYLNLFNSSVVYFKETGYNLTDITKILQSVEDKFNSSQGKFRDIRSYFSKIENNYSNMTTGVLKTPADYIRNLMDKKYQKLNQTSDALVNISKVHALTSIGFRDLNKSFLETTFTRDNMMNNLIATNSSLDEIRENLDWLRDNLDQLDVELSNVNASLQLMDEVVHERNQALFIERQKHLFVSENLPEILDFYNAVNESLTDAERRRVQINNDIANLQVSKDDVQRLQNEFDNINIPLIRTDSQLKKSEQFTESVSATLGDLNEMFGQINRSVISENAYDIFKDEPLEHTKSVFEESLKILENISENVNQVAIDVNNQKLQLASKQNALTNITVLLDGFKLVHKNSAEHKVNGSAMDSLSIALDDNLKHLLTAMNKYLKHLTDLESSYQGVNKTILNDTLFDLKTLYSNISADLFHVLTEQNDTKDLMSDMHRMVEDIETQLTEYVDTPDHLKRLTDAIRSRQRDLEEIMRNIGLEHESLVHKITQLLRSTTVLKDNLHSAERDLKTQQKKEYIEQNLPILKLRQADLEERVINATDDLLNAEYLTNFMLTLLNSTKAITEDHPNLNMSLEDSAHKLQRMQNGIRNDNGTLIGIELEIERLKVNLTLDYFERTLNNFDIVGLKSVFSAMNSSLNGFEKELDIIDKNDQVMLNDLDKIQNYLNDIDNGRDAMNSVGKVVDASITKWADLLDQFKAANASVVLLEDTMLNITDDLIHLNETFAHVKDSHLRKRLNAVDSIMHILGGQIDSVCNTLDGLDNNNTRKSADVDMLQHLKSLPVKTLEQLYSNIREITTVASGIDNYTVNGEKLLNEISLTANGLLTNLSHINAVSKDLKKDFEKQEKIEFLNRTLPPLQTKNINVFSGLQTTNTAVDKLQHLLTNATDLLQTLTGRLQTSDNVNVSLSEISDRYSDTGTQLENVKNDLNTTEQMLRALNISGLKDDTSLIEDTFSIRNLTQYITGLDSDLNYSWSKINSSEIKTNGMLDELRKYNSDISKLLDDLDTLSQLENKTSMAEQSLSELQKNLTNTDSKIETLISNMQQLNASLEEVIMGMDGFNNTELIEKVWQFKDKIDTNIMKILELDHLSEYGNNTLTNASAILDALDSIFGLVTNSKKGLEMKLKDGSELLNLFNKDMKKLFNTIPAIDRNIPEIVSDVETFKRELANIRKDVELQKIENFIEDNFPDLKETFTSVNNTFIGQTTMLQALEKGVKALQNRTILIEDRLSSHPSLNMTMDGIWQRSDDMMNVIDSAREILNNISLTFSGVGLELTKDSNSNDTIEDIKDRFSKKLRVLVGLNIELKNLTGPLAIVEKETRIYDDELSDNNNTISLYESMRDRLASLNSLIDNLNASSEDVSKQIANNSKAISTLYKDIKAISHRFSNVSDEILNQTFKDIRMNISNEDEHLSFLQELHKLTYQNLLNQRKALAENEVILNDPVYSFQELQAHLTGVSNVTQMVSSSIPFINKNFTNIQKSLDIQAEHLPNINEKILMLEELYEAEEKDNFVDYYMPLLSELTDRVRYVFNKSMLETGRNNVDKTEYQLYKMKKLLESHSLLNISSDILQSQIDDMRHKLNDSNTDFQNEVLRFNKLNFSAFLPETYLQLPIEKLRSEYARLNLSLHDILLAVADTDRTVNNTIQDSIAEQIFINDTSETIEKYLHLHPQSDIVDQMLNLTKSKVDDTNKRFSDFDQLLKSQMADLNNALLNSSDISNTTKMLIEEFTNTTNKMAMDLPVIRDQFTDDVVKPVRENENTFKLTKAVLSNTINTFEQLEYTTVTGQNQLANVTETNKNLNEQALDYQQKIRSMQRKVEKNDHTLSQIKQLLRRESKENFIEAKFPEIAQKFEKLNVSLARVFEELKSNNDSLNNVREHINIINNDTAYIWHISTLTTPQADEANIINDVLENMLSNLTSAANTYSSFNISQLNGQKLIINDNITISQIEKRYMKYTDSFRKLEATADYVSTRNNEIKPKISSLDDQLNALDNMLLLSSNLEKDIESLGTRIVKVNENMTELSNNVDEAATILQKFNRSLAQLKMNYGHFLDNTTEEEMMIEKAQSKIDALRMFLEDAGKDYVTLDDDHKISYSTFYHPKSASETLRSTLDTVSRRLPITTVKVSELANEIDKARKEIPVIDSHLKSITDTVTDLEWMMSNQQNKSNIFKTIKPLTEKKLLSASHLFKQTNNSLRNVTSYGNRVMDALKYIEDRLQNIPAVNIPLTDLNDNVSNIMNRIATLNESYNKLWDIFDALNDEIVSYNVLNESLTVEDVEKKYESFNKTLHDIVKDLHKITDQTYALQPKLEAIDTKASAINSSLDEYHNEDTEIANLGGSLYTVETSLKEAKDRVKKLTKDIKNATTSFMSLKERYSDVTHKASENISKADSILQIATDFLSDVVLTLENLTNQVSDAKSGLKFGYDILHGGISIYDKLTESVQDVFKRNNKIQRQLDDVKTGIGLVSNETMFVNASLEDIPQMLDHLSKLLNREQKRKYINEVYPQYESKSEYINVSLSDTFNKLRVTEELLRSVAEIFQVAKSKIMNIPSVNISMSNFKDEILSLNNTLEQLFGSAKDALRSYASLDSNDLIGQDILETDTITLKILQEKYNSSRSIINETKVLLEWIGNQDRILKINVVNTQHNISGIIVALNRFEEVSYDYNLVSENVNAARENKTEVNQLLDNAKGRIRSVDTLLSRLEMDYSEFEYNSSLERQMINDLKGVIDVLDTKFSNVSSQFFHLENDLKDTNRTLYDIIDDPNVLNDMFWKVKKNIIALKEALDTFRTSLNQIKNDIPNINIEIGAADNALTDMENILKSQQNKAQFVENAKPALQDRLDNTTNAFRTTNLSLELMRKQIEELQAYVDAVNNRLDGLPTVNISLTDIDSNITEMENRLIIMQDYYDNVQEVIAQLHGSIDYFDIFDTNLTLGNVENRYDMFNHTIDGVNAVLGKIGREFDSFGSQFININSTLGNIDDAVSRFEEKTTKIKVLENDVQSFGSLLNDTNRNIEDMLSATRQLNDSFLLMKQNYSEVINRTENKNLDIERKINDVANYLKDAKKIIDNVTKLYLASQSNVSMINQSLFKDIYTYNDLNTTLTDVKAAYATIRSQLKDMKQIIEHKSNETNDHNSTIIGVSSILEDLKQILAEEQMDLEKVKYINSHIDDLNSQFTALQTPFQNTKDSISKHSKEIGDVHMLATKTGNRLNRFRTLDISTDPERRKAEELKTLMTELNANLTATDETILKIENLMSSLENRNASIDDIKAKFASVNSSINALYATLDDIHAKLEKAKNETAESSDTLLKFQSQMNEFKSLQKGLAKVRNLMNTLDSRTSESVKDLGETDAIMNKLAKTVQAMDLMQTILGDPDYKVFQPKAISNLTTFNESHKQLEETSSTMLKKLDQAKQSLDKLVKSIKQSLTRENITKALADLKDQLENTTKLIDEMNTPTQENNKKSNNLLSDVRKLDENAEFMKDILTKELDKYQLVKNTLPILQVKHGMVNQTLVEFKPEVEDVKSKLAHIKEVMTKIKEKMSIFGVDDSDGKVAQWDKQIKKIEDGIKEAEMKQRNSMDTINRLKADLWKDVKDVYTKDDTIQAVKSKLDNYNKTLDEIDVSLDAKAFEIKDLDILASKMGQDLVDRNMILTTTPATTTPSGAPECEYSTSGPSCSKLTMSLVNDSLKFQA